MVELDKPQIKDNIIRRMRIAWWVSKATDTHTQNIYGRTRQVTEKTAQKYALHAG
jgi:hypothetical protein